PMPEERLGFPTVGKDWRAVTETDRKTALLKEIEYVLIHSSSRYHIDLKIAAEVVSGGRRRMSFAPMVLSAGMLMAYEVIALLLDRPRGTDYRGWFFNPYRPAVERPRSAVTAFLLAPLIRWRLRQMLHSS